MVRRRLCLDGYAGTNGFIGGASPASYLPKIEKSAGITSEELDDLLRTHEIDPQTLRSADFDAFFLARPQRC